MDIFLHHTSHGIWLILLLSMPVVLLAAAIGLIIGILQAVTQVQEQTISAAPKLALVFLLIIFGGPMMMQILQDYMIESVRLGTEVIIDQQQTAMPLTKSPHTKAEGFGNSKEQFFKERDKAPQPSKVKTMFQNPSGSYMGGHDVEGPNVKTKVKPAPKMSVPEKLYKNRRASGNLPKPPNNP